MSRPVLAACLALAASWPALVQGQPVTEFPANAVMISAQDLHKRVAGNVYVATIGSNDVRLQFQSSYAFLNIGSGASDTGPWRAEGSQLCFEWKRTQSGCVEVRFVGDVMHLKRLNGEIVEYKPR